MNQMQSLSNKEIRTIMALKTKKGRYEQQQFIAEGSRICKTLIHSPLKLIQLYATEAMFSEAKRHTSENNITIISESCMSKISHSTTPSGILAIFAIPEHNIPEKIKPGLVLANISDPGNMGTLIRSSLAFGFQQIITIEGCEPWNPKVIQASAGTIGYVSIYSLSWDQLKNHKNRPSLSALVPSNGNAKKNFEKNHLLIVGNEAHGIPASWIKECDHLITLPMPGKIESLNAAVAGSIALYLSINQ